jgi:hypothetical protein
MIELNVDIICSEGLECHEVALCVKVWHELTTLKPSITSLVILLCPITLVTYRQKRICKCSDILNTPVYQKYLRICYNGPSIIMPQLCSYLQDLLLPACCMSVSCLTYSLTLKTEATCSSETLTSNRLRGVISQKAGRFLALLFKHKGKYIITLPLTKYVRHQVKNILLECHVFFHIIQKFLPHQKWA